MNSFNHYSLGSVGDWLFGRVAGIDQAPGRWPTANCCCARCPAAGSPGPGPSRRPHAARVACGWSLADGRITVTATVPPGSTAVLEIPTPDPDSVREERRARGRPAGGSRGRAVSRRGDPAADVRPLHLQRRRTWR